MMTPLAGLIKTFRREDTAAPEIKKSKNNESSHNANMASTPGDTPGNS